MNRLEILQKRNKLHSEIEELQRISSLRMKYKKAMQINKMIKEKKIKYNILNNMLKEK